MLHELLVSLPHEDFVYLGDTARFPYGERTPAELERFCVEIAEELIARSVKLLVVACNTATSAALPALRRRMMETTLGIDVLAVVRAGDLFDRSGDLGRDLLRDALSVGALRCDSDHGGEDPCDQQDQRHVLHRPLPALASQPLAEREQRRVPAAHHPVAHRVPP